MQRQLPTFKYPRQSIVSGLKGNKNSTVDRSLTTASAKQKKKRHIEATTSIDIPLSLWKMMQPIEQRSLLFLNFHSKRSDNDLEKLKKFIVLLKKRYISGQAVADLDFDIAAQFYPLPYVDPTVYSVADDKTLYKLIKTGQVRDMMERRVLEALPKQFVKRNKLTIPVDPKQQLEELRSEKFSPKDILKRKVGKRVYLLDSFGEKKFATVVEGGRIKPDDNLRVMFPSEWTKSYGYKDMFGSLYPADEEPAISFREKIQGRLDESILENLVVEQANFKNYMKLLYGIKTEPRNVKNFSLEPARKTIYLSDGFPAYKEDGNQNLLEKGLILVYEDPDENSETNRHYARVAESSKNVIPIANPKQNTAEDDKEITIIDWMKSLTQDLDVDQFFKLVHIYGVKGYIKQFDIETLNELCDGGDLNIRKKIKSMEQTLQRLSEQRTKVQNDEKIVDKDRRTFEVGKVDVEILAIMSTIKKLGDQLLVFQFVQKEPEEQKMESLFNQQLQQIVDVFETGQVEVEQTEILSMEQRLAVILSIFQNLPESEPVKQPTAEILSNEDVLAFGLLDNPLIEKILNPYNRTLKNIVTRMKWSEEDSEFAQQILKAEIPETEKKHRKKKPKIEGTKVVDLTPIIRKVRKVFQLSRTDEKSFERYASVNEEAREDQTKTVNLRNKELFSQMLKTSISDYDLNPDSYLISVKTQQDKEGISRDVRKVLNRKLQLGSLSWQNLLLVVSNALGPLEVGKTFSGDYSTEFYEQVNSLKDTKDILSLITREEEIVWKKGLLEHFQQANNITFRTLVKMSLSQTYRLPKGDRGTRYSIPPYLWLSDWDIEIFKIIYDRIIGREHNDSDNKLFESQSTRQFLEYLDTDEDCSIYKVSGFSSEESNIVDLNVARTRKRRKSGEKGIVSAEEKKSAKLEKKKEKAAAKERREELRIEAKLNREEKKHDEEVNQRRLAKELQNSKKKETPPRIPSLEGLYPFSQNPVIPENIKPTVLKRIRKRKEPELELEVPKTIEEQSVEPEKSEEDDTLDSLMQLVGEFNP